MSNTNPLIQALQEVTGEKFPLAREHLAFAVRHISKERERTLVSCKTLREKKELLSSWFGGYLAPEVENTIALLAEEEGLEAVRREMRMDEPEEIRITTAKKLGEETRSWIRKELGEATGASIIFREDPTLLGGVRINAGDKEVENSLRQRLAHI
ncbi:MAG: F0F1 ATP synthase subunit delta [Nanoarchaeota archaeon]|nr:F0F1 ATP synthase subunit delta [Nanoarchaeota archaeon]